MVLGLNFSDAKSLENDINCVALQDLTADRVDDESYKGAEL